MAAVPPSRSREDISRRPPVRHEPRVIRPENYFIGEEPYYEPEGLDEGASTRLLVHPTKLMAADILPVDACRSAVAQALTDDSGLLSAVNELSASLFRSTRPAGAAREGRRGLLFDSRVGNLQQVRGSGFARRRN